MTWKETAIPMVVQGGYIREQGNVPITPLIDAGCTHVIVCHLNQGTLWHRGDFPQASIIEIRPGTDLDMGFSAMFDFSEEKNQNLAATGLSRRYAAGGTSIFCISAAAPETAGEPTISRKPN